MQPQYQHYSPDSIAKLKLGSKMFEEPTVIITGAGSSMEFGLPSGKDIFATLEKEAKNSISRWQGQPALINDGIIPTPSFSFFNLISYLDEKDKVFQTQLQQIGRTIDLQFDDSIDEYLYNNEKFQEVGKLLSVWRLYCSLYQEAIFNNKKILSRRDDHMFKTSPIKNATKSWLASLAHKITKDCQNVEELNQNKLTIITYNYDSLIEEGLYSLIRASGKFEKLKKLDFIDIIHVNGKLKTASTFPLKIEAWSGKSFLQQDILQDIKNNSKNIFMVNENTDIETSAVRKVARNYIKNSQKIFSLGFAFDKNNVELIGLDKLTSTQKLYALNYDNGIQLKNRIGKISENNNTIIGSNTSPISSSEAVQKGFFDQ